MTVSMMECLLAIMEEFEAKMMANMDVCLAEMRAWQKEVMACQEVTEACLDVTVVTVLKSVARKLLVKRQQTEKTLYVCDSVIVICSYDR
jgi:hypothetical protein